jgi:hypothetical protein
MVEGKNQLIIWFAFGEWRADASEGKQSQFEFLTASNLRTIGASACVGGNADLTRAKCTETYEGRLRDLTERE